MTDSVATYDETLDAPGLPVVRGKQSRATAIACRTLDIAVAAVALVVLSPVLLVIAIWIRVDTRGPSLFRQERLGRDMKPFVVNKFRTMHMNMANDEHVAFVQRLIEGKAERYEEIYKLTEDGRITGPGRILRKTSLDELPQLVNVLRGEMSLCGPRPCLDYEAQKYPPQAFGRFAVKPGLTGLWQVSGRSRLTFHEMIALDLEYAARRSFWLDVKILLRTLPVVFDVKRAA